MSIDAAASLLGWWRDAGVDVAVGETPFDWLGTAVPPKPPVPVVKPHSLETLVDHLMTGDVPGAGPPRRRVAPGGDPSSDLMILADFPEPDDVASNHPLSGPIFDKMLDALGRSRDSVYTALLSPGRPVTGRLTDESVAALSVLAKQHIALVAPKSLWLVGTAASRAILGIDDAAAKGKLHKVNLSGTIVDAIATAHPRMFDDSKSRKAAAWVEMQRLIVREDA